ncbi:MAG: phosphodiesterase [Pseudomonadota bacterium]
MTAAPIRLVQITDMHLCATPGDFLHAGIDTDETLSLLLRQIEASERQPDLLLATGDLAHDPVAAVYQRLQSRLAALASPVYTLCGNHDDPLLAARYLCCGNVSCDGELQLDNWLLIFLDSSQPGRVDGELSAAELHRLQQLLLASGERHVMIFLHHPPVAIGSPWMDEIRLSSSEAFYALIDRFHQVKAVVFGHIHQQFESTRGEVSLIGSPATSVQFKPRTDTVELDVLPPGYRRFELFDNGSFSTSVEWLK